jgi:predicted HTH domain antitoxin
MIITLPADFEGKIAPADLALHLAIGLYVGDKVTLGQGASIAGLSQPGFLQELGKRKIPIHYGLEEAAEDIAAVEQIIASGAAR